MSPLPASLLFSLWQGGLIWGGLCILNCLVPASRSDLRYKCSLAGLFLVAGLWVATWSYESKVAEAGQSSFQPTLSPQLDRETEAIKVRTVATNPQESVAIPWQQNLVIIWQVGVVLGFARLVWSVRLAKKVRSESVKVESLLWTIPLKRLCEKMGHRIEVGLQVSAQVTCPVVMGFLQPVIILPASALTGVPSEVLKATLAHEIAHLVRWDYVFNLLQMGIEAFLFFNPFIWMISESVRREREACCDLMASEACGDALTYSEALVWWSREATTTFAAALAVGGSKSGIHDRVWRLLYPQAIPVARSGWLGATSVATAVALSLLLFGSLVHATVAELTPKQRVNLIEQLSQPFREQPAQKVSSADSQTFSGTVVDEKGNPVPQAEWCMSSVALVDPWRARTGLDGKFSGKAPDALMTLWAQASDFAPTVLTCEKGGRREGLLLVLFKGHDFRVQCVDEQGAGIPGVKITAESSLIPFWRSRATTDEKGWATLTHQPTIHSAGLTFYASEYQTARRDNIDLSGAGPSQPFSLVRTKPVLIMVKDEVTGTPMPGVLIRVCGVWPQDSSFVYPDWNSSGIVTDSQGEARLNGLNPDLNYDMKAEGGGRGMTFRLNPKDALSQTILLPKERFLKLKFINLPDLPDAKLTIQYGQRETENSSNASHADLKITNGEANIDLKGFMPKPVDIYFLNQWVHSPDLTKEVTDFVVDYNQIKPPVSVHVIVKAKVESGQAPPKGAYWINWALTKDAGVWQGLSVPIHDGVAEFDLPKNSYFQLHNTELLGGKIDDSVRYQVTGNPTQVEVPVVAAGVIRVRVLEPNGHLADNTFILAQDSSDPNHPRIDVKNEAMVGDAREWYISQPIELKSNTYQVVASSGLRYAVSQPFKVDAANPIQDVVLTLPTPVTRTIRAVDSDGNVLGGVNLMLEMEVPPVGAIYGQSITTDANGIGRITLGIGALPEKLSVQPINTVLVPAKYPVEFSGVNELTIVMQKGKRLFGRFVDHSAGADLKQCSVQWMTQSVNMNSDRKNLDADGGFEFDNVPDQGVFLSTGIPNGKKAVGNFYVRPSDKELTFEIQDGK